MREVVNRFAPAVSGVISVRPGAKGVRQSRRCKVVVELGAGVPPSPELADAIAEGDPRDAGRFDRDRAGPHGALPRSEYKSKIVDYSRSAELKSVTRRK